MRSSLIIALLISATATPLLAQGRTVEFETLPHAADIDSASQSHDEAIRRDRHDRMTVQVRLGGSGPYHFLVDTGSDRTALSRQLADRLGLKAAGTARLHSVTGMSEVTTVMLPQLQLSGKDIEVAHAPLLDRENIGADGILGIDSLRSQRLQFDFPNRTMTIVPSVQRVSSEERDAIIVEARRRNGRLILTRARADGVPVTIILDTGSQLSIANEPLRRELARRRSLPQLGQVELQSVTGEKLIGDYMFLKTLDLGNVALANLVTVFAEAHTFQLLGLADQPAILLGMNALRGFEKVSIDFDRKQLRVRTPQKSELNGTMMAARANEGH
ncbi:MAG TPA: retroviral-like aspartic protease family protein [Sphingomicrobium sp.]|nr:retroviral-like aspartic protease family protein [Sphingomicrobium sp.]